MRTILLSSILVSLIVAFSLIRVYTNEPKQVRIFFSSVFEMFSLAMINVTEGFEYGIYFYTSIFFPVALLIFLLMSHKNNNVRDLGMSIILVVFFLVFKIFLNVEKFLIEIKDFPKNIVILITLIIIFFISIKLEELRREEG